ncbi:glutamate-rich protein 2 isoform X3 [Pelodiscus sinensis]|uniref:glutamate-rich protein 2 isoform X3 n=1 Tax=Pelodiscus sinensis TaxID=13735 RepID=UPI003F6D82E0
MVTLRRAGLAPALCFEPEGAGRPASALGLRHEQVRCALGLGDRQGNNPEGLWNAGSDWTRRSCACFCLDGFILKACLTLSRQNSLERTDAIKDQKCRQNGRLQVFGPKEEVVIEPIQTVPWQHGCQPESTNKIYPPTKQIALCAAKSTFEKWDTSAKSIKNKKSSKIQETNLRSPHYMQENTDKEKNSRNVEKTANNELSAEFQTNSIDDQNNDEQLSETTDDDESSSELDENEDRKRKAPIELLGEFLKAIMDQDYSLAKKLCQMILIYEPENTEAKQFLPVIEEKLLIESTQNCADEEEEETDERSSEDSGEDTSSADSSNDGDTSSDDSDENI